MPTTCQEMVIILCVCWNVKTYIFSFMHILYIPETFNSECPIKMYDNKFDFSACWTDVHIETLAALKHKT